MGFELRFSNNPVAELTKHFETSENSLNFQECHSKSVHVNISCHLSLAAQVPSLTLFFFFNFFFGGGTPDVLLPYIGFGCSGITKPKIPAAECQPLARSVC